MAEAPTAASSSSTSLASLKEISTQALHLVVRYADLLKAKAEAGKELEKRDFEPLHDISNACEAFVIACQDLNRRDELRGAPMSNPFLSAAFPSLPPHPSRISSANDLSTAYSHMVNRVPITVSYTPKTPIRIPNDLNGVPAMPQPAGIFTSRRRRHHQTTPPLDLQTALCNLFQMPASPYHYLPAEVSLMRGNGLTTDNSCPPREQEEEQDEEYQQQEFDTEDDRQND